MPPSSDDPSTPVLIVGFGSIGRRHAEVLSTLGCSVGVVSRRTSIYGCPWPAWTDLKSAIECLSPSYIVIATETARHHGDLLDLADSGFKGRVLVEKPLFGSPRALPDLPVAEIRVGYNLRFHPAIQALKEALAGELALSVEASVGQYLPDWRPGTDYRTSYSAKRAEGGGVLRDLSHEIDLLIWLFGQPAAVVAMGGRVSDLAIDSDDAWSVLIRQSGSAMTVLHLDYLHRPGRRTIHVETKTRSICLDLIAGCLTIDGRPRSIAFERNDSYRQMHAAMIGRRPTDDLCDALTGLTVLQTITAIERSATEEQWVRLR